MFGIAQKTSTRSLHLAQPVLFTSIMDKKLSKIFVLKYLEEKNLYPRKCLKVFTQVSMTNLSSKSTPLTMV